MCVSMLYREISGDLTLIEEKLGGSKTGPHVIPATNKLDISVDSFLENLLAKEVTTIGLLDPQILPSVISIYGVF